ARHRLPRRPPPASIAQSWAARLGAVRSDHADQDWGTELHELVREAYEACESALRGDVWEVIMSNRGSAARTGADSAWHHTPDKGTARSYRFGSSVLWVVTAAHDGLSCAFGTVRSSLA